MDADLSAAQTAALQRKRYPPVGGSRKQGKREKRRIWEEGEKEDLGRGRKGGFGKREKGGFGKREKRRIWEEGEKEDLGRGRKEDLGGNANTDSVSATILHIPSVTPVRMVMIPYLLIKGLVLSTPSYCLGGKIPWGPLFPLHSTRVGKT